MQIYLLVKTLQSPVVLFSFINLSFLSLVLPKVTFCFNSYQHVTHTSDLHFHWSMIAGNLPEHTFLCLHSLPPVTLSPLLLYLLTEDS